MAEFTFTVTNVVSDAEGGLQNTIDRAFAQVTNPGDTIVINFDASLSGQTIVLTNAIDIAGGDITIDGDLNDDETPDITISGDLNGNGAADSGDVAFLTVRSGATATFKGVVFEDGFSTTDPAGEGGNASLIANYGTLTFNDVLIKDSTADKGPSSSLQNLDAATILNTGVFSAEDLHIENVSSKAGDGNSFIDDGGDAVVGILNTGTTNLNRVAISADQVSGGDGSIDDDGNADGGDARLGVLTRGGGVNRGYNNSFIFGTGAADLFAGTGVGSGQNGSGAAAIETSGPIPFEGAFIGYSGDDTITATTNTFLASFGDDVIRSSENDDRLFGGAGDDYFLQADAAAANGTDELFGGGGDDTFRISSAGSITVSGDTGNDSVQFNTSFGVDARLNVDGQAQQSNGLAGLIFIESGIENLGGTAFDDTLIGDDGANRLLGLGGADQLFGGDGADSLSGGDGDDLLRAGTGVSDTLSGGSGNDTLTIDGGTSTIANGGNDDDLIQFNGGVDAVVDGGDGADTMQFFQTQSSFSIFRGDDANTFLVKPAGQPSNFSGEGAVTVQNVESFVFSDATLTTSQLGAIVDAAQAGGGTDTANGGDAGGDAGGGSNANGGPTPGDDVLIGTTGDDRIDALAGNDMVTGLAGADTLIGGGGKDTLKGGGGADRLNGGGGRDELKGGGGADRLKGNGGRDDLKGGGGGDRLIGNGGKDRLEGQGGNDTLKGGGGSDQFVFARNKGKDLVLDFRDGQDKLVIKSGAESFADLSISDGGSGAIVAFSGGMITLRGVQSQLLDESDFIF